MSPMSPYHAVLGSHIGLSEGRNWATGIVDPTVAGTVPATVSRAMSTNRSEVGKIVIGGGMAYFPPLPRAALAGGASSAGASCSAASTGSHGSPGGSPNSRTSRGRTIPPSPSGTGSRPPYLYCAIGAPSGLDHGQGVERDSQAAAA